MAKTRDILIHVGVERAERRRKCQHSRKHSIEQGEPCLTIRHRSFNSHHNYCSACAALIVEAARQRLDEVARAVGVA